MKVDYKSILESYEIANREFLNECAEIAMEADTLNATNATAKEAPNSTQNQVQGNTNQSVDTTKNNQLQPSSKQKQNLLQRLREIFKKIVDRIQQASIKIINRLKLMFESDKAFQTTLSQRRATQQPLKNFKAITYSYDDQYLDTTINGIQKLALGSIKQLANFTGTSTDSKIKQIIESDQSAVSNVMLSFFTKEKSKEGGPDVQTFSREMIDTFRGQKQEKMWNQSSIPMLMIQSKGSADLSTKCNNMINECKNTVNVLKGIEAKARTQQTSEALLNISRRVNKAMSIYNTFLTLTQMYFELKLEQCLAARMLLKKFYQF